MDCLGIEILASFNNCKMEDKLFNDKNYIRDLMLEASKLANCTYICDHFKSYDPCGISGIIKSRPNIDGYIIISESHLRIHTWAEIKFARIDLFTCGDRVFPDKAYDFLIEKFKVDEKDILKRTECVGEGKLKEYLEVIKNNKNKYKNLFL